MALMNKKPFIIGITGGSGSGKTFFLKSFQDHFRSDEICLISQDDYYVQVDGLSAEENKFYNFDLPASTNGKLFLGDIKKLIDGQTIYKKEYTFNKPGAVAKTLEINPAPLIIVEGLFILYFEEISSLLDLKIFIEADEEIALQRRIRRDGIERGYAENDVLYKWNNHVIPAYSDFLLPHKDTCHKLISNNTNIAADLRKSAEELSYEIKVQIKR